jgi:chromosome segregation ATPase
VKVEIVEAIGGEIKAEDIKIDNCKSNVKASASKKIEILELNGSENIFKIDPLLLDTLNQDVEENKEKVSKLAAAMVKLKDEIQRYTVLVKDNAPMFDEISKKLASYKKQGIKFPNSLVSQHQQLTKAQEYLKNIKDSYKIKDDECMLLTNKTASFQEDLFNARIINRDKWTDHNELIFKLIDPDIELSFKPKEGSTDMIFAIVKTEEEKFEIQAVEE